MEHLRSKIMDILITKSVRFGHGFAIEKESFVGLVDDVLNYLIYMEAQKKEAAKNVMGTDPRKRLSDILLNYARHDGGESCSIKHYDFQAFMDTLLEHFQPEQPIVVNESPTFEGFKYAPKGWMPEPGETVEISDNGRAWYQAEYVHVSEHGAILCSTPFTYKFQPRYIRPIK